MNLQTTGPSHLPRTQSPSPFPGKTLGGCEVVVWGAIDVLREGEPQGHAVQGVQVGDRPQAAGRGGV